MVVMVVVVVFVVCSGGRRPPEGNERVSECPGRAQGGPREGHCRGRVLGRW